MNAAEIDGAVGEVIREVPDITIPELVAIFSAIPDVPREALQESMARLARDV